MREIKGSGNIQPFRRNRQRPPEIQPAFPRWFTDLEESDLSELSQRQMFQRMQDISVLPFRHERLSRMETRLVNESMRRRNADDIVQADAQILPIVNTDSIEIIDEQPIDDIPIARPINRGGKIRFLRIKKR